MLEEPIGKTEEGIWQPRGWSRVLNKGKNLVLAFSVEGIHDRKCTFGSWSLKYLKIQKGAQAPRTTFLSVECNLELLITSHMKQYQQTYQRINIISTLVTKVTNIFYLWTKFLLVFSADIFTAFYCHIGVMSLKKQFKNQPVTCASRGDRGILPRSLPHPRCRNSLLLVVLLFISQQE